MHTYIHKHYYIHACAPAHYTHNIINYREKAQSVNSYSQTHTHIQTHKHTHKHIHTHTHKHTHTHTFMKTISVNQAAKFSVLLGLRYSKCVLQSHGSNYNVQTVTMKRGLERASILTMQCVEYAYVEFSS